MTRTPPIHPLHAAMLAGTVPLFLGALLTDYAYWSSFQIEWSIFASWLIIGGLVFGAVALLFAVVGQVRGGGRSSAVYTLLLAAAWVLGFVNALVHARDAWAIMPTGLVLSAMVALLACAATWVRFSRLHGDMT
jgi:uncharacterized membrane protein